MLNLCYVTWLKYLIETIEFTAYADRYVKIIRVVFSFQQEGMRCWLGKIIVLITEHHVSKARLGRLNKLTANNASFYQSVLTTCTGNSIEYLLNNKKWTNDLTDYWACAHVYVYTWSPLRWKQIKLSQLCITFVWSGRFCWMKIITFCVRNKCVHIRLCWMITNTEEYPVFKLILQ